MFGNVKKIKLSKKEKRMKKKDVYEMLLSIGPAKKAVIYILSVLLVIIYMLPFYWMFIKMFRSSIFAHFPPDLNLFSKTSLGNFISNFKDVLSFGSFPLWYFNSVFVAAVVVAGSVIVGSLAGYAFARLHFKGRDVLFYAVLATLMIPFPVISIASYIFMLDLGWISTYQGLILPEIVSGLNVFIFRQYFMTIPADVENAAKLDGLNPFQIFYKISAPMAKPAFAAATIYTFIGAWNNFLWPLMEVHSQKLFTLPLVLNFFKGVNGTQIYWNEMMTVVFLTMIPTLVIYIIFERFFVEGFTLSGVKG